jgi:hypothetical protein
MVDVVIFYKTPSSLLSQLFVLYLDTRHTKAHIPLIMEGEKQLGKRIREQIIALVGGRKEIQNMKAKRRQICNLSQVLKRN